MLSSRLQPDSARQGVGTSRFALFPSDSPPSPGLVAEELRRAFRENDLRRAARKPQSKHLALSIVPFAKGLV